MGYKVFYPTVGKRKYPKHKKLPQWVLYTGICGTSALFFLLYCLWQGSISVLLPGDPEVTGPALEVLIDRLSSGEALGDAVMAFCREVVAGAR